MALTGASRYSRRPSRRSPRSGDWLLTPRRSKLAVGIRQDEKGHHARQRQGTRRRVLGCVMRGRRVTGRHRSPQPLRYEIRVRGRLGETVCSALQARARGQDTVLTGVLADQAARYGALAECEALGLELGEVRSPGPAGQSSPGRPAVIGARASGWAAESPRSGDCLLALAVPRLEPEIEGRPGRA